MVSVHWHQIQIWFKTHLLQSQKLLRLNYLICPREVTVPFTGPFKGQRSSNVLRAIGVGQTSSRSFAENGAQNLSTSPGNIPKLWLRPCEAQSPPTGRNGHSHRPRALGVQLLGTHRARNCERESKVFEQSALSTINTNGTKCGKIAIKLTACTWEARTAMKAHSKSSLQTKSSHSVSAPNTLHWSCSVNIVS